MKLEQPQNNSGPRGIAQNATTSVQWLGSAQLKITYKTADNKVANERLITARNYTYST